MDVTWIPGDADLVVVIIAALAVIGGAVAAVRRGGKTPPASPDTAQRPADAPRATVDDATDTAAPVATRTLPAEAAVVTEAPEAAETRLARLRSRLGGGLGQSLLAIFSRGTLGEDDWDERGDASARRRGRRGDR
ncbi:hypothetical protein GCM10025876_32070 [Demequina litorisediminis]|uniref:Signal recognition particle-docking protein FtsY n=1 Tax=Demequina litorisediminis TaxID=1849022 RepID=A0ABQ6IIN9_9MICO|nr:hypothetical protein GCM10025876_32070 [Demequina litorisediminis]